MSGFGVQGAWGRGENIPSRQSAAHAWWRRQPGSSRILRSVYSVRSEEGEAGCGEAGERTQAWSPGIIASLRLSTQAVRVGSSRTVPG